MILEEARKNGYYVRNYHDLDRIHSAYDPDAEAKKLLPTTAPQSNKFIVLGGGLGYILKHLGVKFKNSQILVFEPFPELLEKGHELNIWSEKQFSKLKIIGPGCPDMLQQLGDFISLEDYDAYSIIRWPDYQKKKPNFFRQTTATVKRLRQYYQVNLNTLRDRGKEWLENFRQNFTHLSDSKRIVFPDSPVPVAVVAAGPSLDQQMDWLKNNAKKLFIICVNTAGPILKKRGIRVDIHAAMDAQNIVAEDIFHSDVNHLLLSPFASPEIIEKTNAPFTLLALQSPLTEWMLTAPFLPNATSAGSVTVTLLDYLFTTSNNPVYLLGGDMEFSGNRYYARGTYREDKLLKRCDRFNSFVTLLLNWQQKEKNMGQKENPRLKDERDWLKMQAASENKLFIPPPQPGWWKKEAGPPEPEDTRDRIQFTDPDKQLVNKWHAEQRKLFRLARQEKKTTEGWRKFCFWIKQIFDDPGEEFEKWDDLLANSL